MALIITPYFLAVIVLTKRRIKSRTHREQGGPERTTSPPDSLV